MDEQKLEQLKTQCKEILAAIARARSTSGQPLSLDDLEIIGEEILQRQAYFIGPLIDAETAYRQRIQELRDEGEDGKRMSFAAAENLARTEPIYALWKKAQMVYELAGDQVMLIKKAMSSRDYEYNNSK